MEENETPDFIEERDIFGLIKPKVILPEVIDDVNKDDNKDDNATDLSVEYAGLGSRIIAYLLDAVILAIPIGFFSWAISVSSTNSEYSILSDLLALFIWVLYYGVTESSDSQATFGKRICGIKVIDDKGNKLTFNKAALRYLATIISILPLGFGIWAIADVNNEKKQAWHDMLLGCYVIVNHPELIKKSELIEPPEESNANSYLP